MYCYCYQWFNEINIENYIDIGLDVCYQYVIGIGIARGMGIDIVVGLRIGMCIDIIIFMILVLVLKVV